MVKIPKIDYVAYLVNRKFPDLMPPFPIGLQFKQYDGIIHSDEDEWLPPSNEIVEKAKIYREKLSGFPKPGLKKLYQAELIKQYEDDDQKRFFNLPNAAADFEYWSKMAHWTLDEALALSFGKNPKVVSWKSLEKIISYTSPFVLQFRKNAAKYIEPDEPDPPLDQAVDCSNLYDDGQLIIFYLSSSYGITHASPQHTVSIHFELVYPFSMFRLW